MRASEWIVIGLLLLCGVGGQRFPRREGQLVRETILAASDFGEGEDGWLVLGEDVHLQVEGEYLTGSDEGQAVWFFSAPPKFLGDMREAYQGSIKFSMGHFHANSAGRDPIKMEDVVLVSDLHNLTLIRTDLFAPWSNDQEVEVALDPPSWKHAISEGSCTEEELLLTLSSLSGFLIRGGHYYGPEMTWLKDVRILQQERRPEDKHKGQDQRTSSEDKGSEIDPASDDSTMIETFMAEESKLTEVQEESASVQQTQREEIERERSRRQAKIITDLQERMIEMQEENDRLKTIVAELEEANLRYNQAAKERSNKEQECQRHLRDKESLLEDVKEKLEGCEKLRIDALIREEQKDDSRSTIHQINEMIQLTDEKLNRCNKTVDRLQSSIKEERKRREEAEGRWKQVQEEHRNLSAALLTCQLNASSMLAAREDVERLLARPMETLSKHLEEAEEKLRREEEKLAAHCSTKESQTLEVTIHLLLVPYLLLLLALPFSSSSSWFGVTKFLARLGDVVILMFWICMLAYRSYKEEVEKILSSQHLRKLNVVIERTGSTWVGDRFPSLVLFLYGTVIVLHFLSFFRTGDFFCAVRGTFLWGAGLSYFSKSSVGMQEEEVGTSVFLYVSAITIITALEGRLVAPR